MYANNSDSHDACALNSLVCMRAACKYVCVGIRLCLCCIASIGWAAHELAAEDMHVSHANHVLRTPFFPHSALIYSLVCVYIDPYLDLCIYIYLHIYAYLYLYLCLCAILRACVLTHTPFASREISSSTRKLCTCTECGRAYIRPRYMYIRIYTPTLIHAHATCVYFHARAIFVHARSICVGVGVCLCAYMYLAWSRFLCCTLSAR